MILKKIFSASVLELTALLIPILVLPILSAKANVSEMADYLFIVLLILTCQQIVDYSYTYIAGRMNKFELLESFNIIFSAKIMLFFATLLLITPVLFFYVDNFNFTVLAAVAFGCLGALFSAQWLYVSTGDYHNYQLVNFLSKSTIFVAILGFPSVYDFDVFLFLYYFLTLFSAVVVFWLKCKLIEVKRFSFTLKSGWNSIISNYHLFVADFIPQIYVMAPLIFFKGIWIDSSYVALSIAHRFYNAGMTVQWASLKVVIPSGKVFNLKNVERIFIFTFGFSLLKLAAVFLIAGYLIEFMFKQNPDEIWLYLKILAFGFLGAAFYISYGYGFSILSKTESDFKVHAFYLAFPAAAVVWFSSYEYGAIGYAIGLVIARLINGVYFYSNYKRKVGWF